MDLLVDLESMNIKSRIMLREEWTKALKNHAFKRERSYRINSLYKNTEDKKKFNKVMNQLNTAFYTTSFFLMFLDCSTKEQDLLFELD